ncbi:MAG: GNAT family N-acetyltransferase [Gallionella sp.]
MQAASQSEVRLIARQDVYSIVPMLCELNPKLAEDTIRSRLEEMITQGYQCAGVFVQEKLVGICGIWIMTKCYVGKHIEPDNVYLSPDYRSHGLAQQLLAWVYEYGKSQGCVATELNCYISNALGRSFWEKEGYEAIGLHYQKMLDK